MVKVWLSFLVMAVLCLVCTTVYGEEQSGDGWTVVAVGNDDLLSVRVGARPWSGRTELGGFAIWMDGLKEGEDEAAGGGVYATYDVVQDAQFTLLSYQIPVTIYAGGQMGFLHREDSDEDAVCSLLTGVTFGDSRTRIGIEYQYLLDESLWKEFGPIDDRGRLLLSLAMRF